MSDTKTILTVTVDGKRNMIAHFEGTYKDCVAAIGTALGGLVVPLMEAGYTAEETRDLIQRTIDVGIDHGVKRAEQKKEART